jgi:tetratricopeptide (TPR) repeat protein
LKSEGKGAEAETALRTIGTNGLQGREAAEIHLWTARLYIDLGKQRLARGELEDAERQEPNWKPVVEETIWALLTTKDITGAISMVQTLPLLASEPQAPTDPREVIGLGAPSTRPISQELLLSMDDDIRYGKDRDAISSLLGWMYRPSSESVSFLQEVAERDAGRLAVQAALAQAYHQDQDWVLAHKYAQNVVSRQPSNALFQLLRGHALTKLDRWADAEDALNRAIRLGVEDARILQLAAECFKARGDKTRAKELLEQAAVADSANTSVRRSLLALDSRNE